MISAWWQPEGWMKTGTRANAFIRNRKGTGRLWIKDKLVLETHGNRCGVGDHWDDEKTGIVDLAVILQDEAYAQGERELQKFINWGFNTANVWSEVLDVERASRVVDGLEECCSILGTESDYEGTARPAYQVVNGLDEALGILNQPDDMGRVYSTTGCIISGPCVIDGVRHRVEERFVVCDASLNHRAWKGKAETDCPICYPTEKVDPFYCPKVGHQLELFG